jgi:prolyl 4-hydroxylase
MIALDPGKPLVWTVDGFCSQEECRELVERIERTGCEPAPVTTHRGPVMRPDIRNNARTMFDDASLASRLFERARPHLPEAMLGMRVLGANERFRGYRYGVGQRFAPHYDGAFVRREGEQSLVTFLVYLNEGYEGGETAFLDLERTVVPRIGTALFFQHHLLHEGCAVRAGTKYVLRTDVMYVRANAA